MGTRTQKIGIDIFSGAGGLSLGAIAAGIRAVCAVEKDEFAAETFRANHKDVSVLGTDIKEISSLACIRLWDVAEQEYISKKMMVPCYLNSIFR